MGAATEVMKDAVEAIGVTGKKRVTAKGTVPAPNPMTRRKPTAARAALAQGRPQCKVAARTLRRHAVGPLGLLQHGAPII